MHIWIAVFTLALALVAHAKDIHVLVWDEQQPAQKRAYTNFLGHQIASHLRTLPGLQVTSASITDPEQGLSDAAIDQADVLVWWGHVRHGEVNDAKARRIVERIKDGRLSLVALHSAHWAKPFVFAMQERARMDASRKAPPGATLEVIPAPKGAPKANALLTPRLENTNSADGKTINRLILPMCVFPSWRNDGAPSHVTTLLPGHPIARGVPAKFDITQTEMYNEPFHVPVPDAVVFREDWNKGEWFRSGCVWQLGSGRIFYFRPGHEDYPVFTQAAPLKIIANAVLWLGAGGQ